MRYIAALASILAVLTVLSAIPMAGSDSSDAAPLDPNDYVDPTVKITLHGLVGGYNPAESTTVPWVYIFVVYKDSTDPENPKYLYLKLNDEGEMLTTKVVQEYDEVTGKTNYVFNIDAPQIISDAVEYYIYAFNSYKIDAVPPSIKPDGVEITPDEAWAGQETSTYTAYMIKHTGHWADWDPKEEFDLSTDGTETGYKIYLTRLGAEGIVTGHVNGLIGSNTSNLNDVLVRFYRDGEFVRDTNTDRSGNYTVTLPTGKYEVTFSRGNYSCDPIEVTVIEGVTKAKEVTMTMKVDNSFFGQDLSHFLTIIGGVVCALIILISIAFQWRRIKQKKSGKDWILDDMEEFDGKDE